MWSVLLTVLVIGQMIAFNDCAALKEGTREKLSLGRALTG